MADPHMKYLLLTTSDEISFTPAYRVHGFLSFMLTREDDLPMIYCYEIHLWPSLRRRGIGRKLMGLMENIGKQAGVQGTMLTVFTKNKTGKKMYERMSYEVHDSNPSPRRLKGGRTKEPNYQILWKTLEGAWSDGDSEESNEEASIKDEDNVSDVSDEGMDIKEEMDIKDEMDVKDEGMDLKYEAMNVKDEESDVWNDGLDIKQEAIDMKAEGANVDINGEEEKLMIMSEDHNVAVKDEQEIVDAKAKIQGVDVKMKVEGF